MSGGLSLWRSCGIAIDGRQEVLRRCLGISFAVLRLGLPGYSMISASRSTGASAVWAAYTQGHPGPPVSPDNPGWRRVPTVR
jgi:hypothetical protein